MTLDTGETKPVQGEIETKPMIKALVVDDSDSLRALTKIFMKGKVASVDEAENAQGALKMIQSGGYNLLVTDNEMPGMKGTELAKTVRESGSAMVIILVSGDSNLIDNPSVNKENGIDYFLPKPFDRDHFRALLDKVDGNLRNTSKP